ncbi:MAG: thymidylate synthase [Candidatus Omnitrophota bacterium]
MDRNISEIPVIKVECRTIPEVWEKAVLETWDKGLSIRTQYDKEGDPASRDCTMIMVAREPLGEPRIHRAFPGALEDLEVYRQEVVLGIHDHWIKPEEGKWTYTYHKRLFDYEYAGEFVKQIDALIDKLCESHYTRRAQAITWNPKLDIPTDDPPCLQRIWCRLVQGDGALILEMNTHWRSRDAYKASFMNMFALTDLGRAIAESVSRRLGVPVRVGRYVDISDSFHIYGSYFAEFEHFLALVKNRSFDERTWQTEFAEPFFEEARQRIIKEQGAA